MKIHEVTRVSPFSNSPNSVTEFSLPLTFFDTLWFKFPPVERLFFYQLTESTPDFFNSVILPRFKHSLSATLYHYLPLVGYVRWDPPRIPKPTILYTPGDAVSLTVAESDSDFSRLSSHETHEAIESRSLIPELMTSDDKASIISLQITLFPNKGFCIGISAHHAILDGRSTTMFLKSWAYISRQESGSYPIILPPELTPFYGRTVIKDPAGLDMLYATQWCSIAGSDPHTRSLKVLPGTTSIADSVLGTFELTREDIKKLRQKVLSHVTKTKPLYLSTFVLTCAYVWVCIVKAKNVDNDRKLIFGFTGDYRTRLDPPIPTTYFGNCVGGHVMYCEEKGLLEENGFIIVAEKLSEEITRIHEGSILRGAETWVSKMISMDLSKVLAIGVAGSAKFEVYESDFGWGRPKKVEIVSIDRTGAISMAESRDGNGGVEVGLVLKKHELEAFASLFKNGLKCI